MDLYLIHQPFGDYYGSWQAMEELYREGRIRAIGVCNFYPDRLTDLCANASVIPSVDQVELHPFFQQAGALQAMRELGVQPQAWGPLAEGTHGIFQKEVLSAIGKNTTKLWPKWCCAGTYSVVCPLFLNLSTGTVWRKIWLSGILLLVMRTWPLLLRWIWGTARS